MPPITRSQIKQSNLMKNIPYCKENLHTNNRIALFDIGVNNGNKNKKPNKILHKKDNITPINKEEKCINKPQSNILNSINNKTETQFNLKTECLPLNKSKNNTLYYSSSDEIQTSRYSISDKSEVLYTTAQESPEISDLSAQEEPIFEVDELNSNNIIYIGCYARDIFKYLRQREDKFKIIDYMKKQTELTPRHRAIVVNWLVVLQEMFGLNHEVLYSAVDLIDLYLMKNNLSKDKFQVLASAALLLSNKIDVRDPDLPYDLVKQSKFIFTEDELFFYEKMLAKSLNFDINLPLSYVFLRRFARCFQCEMIILTLARYILECSLLEYKLVTTKGSLKSASALYLSFKMCKINIDTIEFHKYTGYNVKEIKNTVIMLNHMLHNPISDLSAVNQKYAHETFYKVARRPLISNSLLFCK